MPSIKEIRYTSKAKKDLKRIRNNPSLMHSLYAVLQRLSAGEPIPDVHRPHKLTGNYRGFMECHIENDFLLIWIEQDYIEVVRIGSHSELFG